MQFKKLQKIVLQTAKQYCKKIILK